LATDWQAISLRTILFAQKALPTTTDLFTGFAGEPPEHQEDHLKAATRKQTGRLDDAVLQVSISPIFVEFALTPQQPTMEMVMANTGLALGELNAELAKFEKRMLNWLPKWEVPTTRVSLLVVARAPADSTAGAYEILKRNLRSVQVKPGDMSDLIFRVNWRANTKTIEEGYYNRLSTWASLKLQGNAGTGPDGLGVRILEKDFAQVEIDINTPAERVEPLPPDRIPTIYQEFFQLAAKIAQVGEPP
jgi:hypothetical protein